MSEPKSFVVSVSVFGDYDDNVPTHATVTLGPEDAARIRKMQKVLKECLCYKMVAFDSLPYFKVPVDPEDRWDGEGIPTLTHWDGGYECCTLNVTDYDFHWRAIIKHTNIYMETESIDISELEGL